MLNPGAEDSSRNGGQPGDLTAAEAAGAPGAAGPAEATAPIVDLPADVLAEDLAADPRRPGTPVSEVVEEYIDE